MDQIGLSRFLPPVTVWGGGCAWLLALSAFWLALRAGGFKAGVSRITVGIHLLLAVLAAVFLFRPEEEVKTGDDPAAYLHMAQAFARCGKLTFDDPALLELEPAERPLFRYGTERFGVTKDHCFWIKDMQTGRVGPWFQPAFPLLLSVPVRLAGPYSALLVTPLFAILSGVLLAMGVGCLTGSRWMPLTFLLFVLHPAIAWNARCVRPELVALCLLLSGMLPAMFRQEGGRGGVVTGAIAGLAAAVSVLFHMTAFYVLIPALLLAAWNARASRFWVGWWSGVPAGLLLLVAQLVFVTDPYGIGPSLMLPSRRLLLSVLVLVCAGVWGLLLNRGWLACRLVGWIRGRVPRKVCPAVGEMGIAGAVAGVLFVLAVIWVYAGRGAAGSAPGLPPWVNAYLSLTDFKGVVSVSSRIWSAGGLAGVLWLGLRSLRPCGQGVQWLVLFGPAALLSGWMYIYMFETRRMIIAVVPLTVIGLVAAIQGGGAVIDRLTARSKGRVACKGWHLQGLPIAWQVVALAVLTVAAVRGREPLYQLWNRKGTLSFFDRVAGNVRANGDFILAEYTQTAAPLAHLSGLPLLPLDSDYRTDADYRRAEKAMARVVLQHPDRRHVFVTPYASAALPGVAMEHLCSTGMTTRLLQRIGQRKVPDKVLDNALTLHLYRVHAGGAGAMPFVRQMDGSRLGIRGGARRFTDRSIADRGLSLQAGVPRRVALGRLDAAVGTLALVLHVPQAPASASNLVSIAWRDRKLDASELRLAPGWMLLEVAVPTQNREAEPELLLLVNADAFLTDVFVSRPGGYMPLDLQASMEWSAFSIPSSDFQWLRADASLALPSPADRGLAWFYASGGQNSRAPAVLSVHGQGGNAVSNACDLESEWAWHVLPYSRDLSLEPGVLAWYDLRVFPAWDPLQPGYPSDLGLLLATVVSVENAIKSANANERLGRTIKARD